MKQSVNYIKHLEAWSDMICCDNRLTPHHISLYYALFHQWNLAKFQNPISVCRSELMLACKIGSANTYTKCLKQLDHWGYIEYKPSYNPMRGSLVNLYNFDNSTNKGSDKGTDKGTVIAVRPSLNSINNKKQSKPNKQERVKSKFSPPTIDQVEEFFIELKSNTAEAEKFHNHFESNGWLVGGKAKMKNCKLQHEIGSNDQKVLTQTPQQKTDYTQMMTKITQHHSSLRRMINSNYPMKPNIQLPYDIIDGYRVFDFKRSLSCLQHIGQKQFGSKFKLHQADRQIIYKLIIYFIRDEENCRKYGLDLQKGILLNGPVGSGKTTLLNLMRYFTYPDHHYVIKTTRDVAAEFNQDGYQVIQKYVDTPIFRTGFS